MEDVAPPTVVISDNVDETFNLSTERLIYTLVFSEAVSGLAPDDFTVVNGTVGDVSGSGETWSVEVAPAWDIEGFVDLTLKAGAVTDAAGNPNEAATDSSQFVDTFAPNAPKLITEADDHFLVNPQVTMETNAGTVVVELYPEQAPVTVANFLAYVDLDFYDSTIFHRLTKSDAGIYVIQGGSVGVRSEQLFLKNVVFEAIALESNNGLQNGRGTIAMARTSVPDSATSQFYINYQDNFVLDYVSDSQPGYAVFGEVVSGLEVIDEFSQLETVDLGGGYTTVPDIASIDSVSQTRWGEVVTNTGVIRVSDLEPGATWYYTLDGWGSYSVGTGETFEVPEGEYPAGSVQVAQEDAAGNLSQWAVKLTSSYVVDVIDPLAYIASYPDLIEAFGMNAEAGLAHFLDYGFEEMREVTFDPDWYIAKYSDLRNVFGADTEAATRHYIVNGFIEGRSVDTTGDDYLIGSVFNDLLPGRLGNDTLDGGEGVDTVPFSGLASGYRLSYSSGTITVQDIDMSDGDDGFDTLLNVEVLDFADRDMRLDNFDGLAYIVSYQDLFEAFDTNREAGLAHYVSYGFQEGRQQEIDPHWYISAHHDLRNAFGDDIDSSTMHYYYFGKAEGRITDPTGDDNLLGSQGDDILPGYAGNDTIDGKEGNDTARFFGDSAGYRLDYSGGVITVEDTDLTDGNEGFDTLENVEILSFADRILSLVEFDPLAYILSYADLVQAFGNDSEAGLAHYIAYGFQEGRSVLPDVVASFTDSGQSIEEAIQLLGGGNGGGGADFG